MKAVLLKGPGECIIEEVTVPEISDDEVLVEVKYCGICGSDAHSIPDCALFEPGTYMGHEFSGIITKLGKNVKGWKIGDRVTANPMYACWKCEPCLHGHQAQCVQRFDYAIGCAPGRAYAGAFAKYIRVPYPERRLFALPDEVSFEEGALVEFLAGTLHCVRQSTFKPRETAMVLGGGPIGLGVVAHLKSAGAALILVTEPMPKRAALARRLGADQVFNPIESKGLKEQVMELTNGRGVDYVFDCSGVASAFKSATDFLTIGGQIVVMGIILKEVPIIPWDFTLNEFRLVGSLAYNTEEFPMVLDFLKRRVSPVTDMITSKIKLSEIVEKGFNKILDPGSGEIKILVSPD